MCQISRKIHGKSFANSRAPQTLFRGAIANEEISEQRIFTTLSQNSRQSMSTT